MLLFFYFSLWLFNRSFVVFGQFSDIYTCGSTDCQNKVARCENCNLMCTDLYSCYGLTISCYGVCNVLCAGQYSCNKMNIILIESSILSTLRCQGFHSCQSMMINSTNSNVNNIQCMSDYSCYQLQLVLYHSNVLFTYCNGQVKQTYEYGIYDTYMKYVNN